jgi:hypothetical protein
VFMPANLLKVLFAVFFMYMGTRLVVHGKRS